MRHRLEQPGKEGKLVVVVSWQRFFNPTASFAFHFKSQAAVSSEPSAEQLAIWVCQGCDDNLVNG